MALQRSLSWSSALNDIRADRSARRLTVSELDARATERRRTLAATQARIAADEAARKAREGEVGYQLRPDRLEPETYIVTLDGVAVGHVGFDRPNGEYWLLADPALNKLPPRFQFWHDYFASLSAIRSFLGIRPVLEAA